MRREGVEWECTRCGKVEFHPYHPLKAKYPDDKPKEWLTVDKDNIHLCPHCAEAYFDVLENFLGGNELHEVVN